MIKCDRIVSNVVHTIELTLDDDKLAVLMRLLHHIHKAGIAGVDSVKLMARSIADGGYEGGDHSALVNKYGAEISEWDVLRIVRDLQETIDRQIRVRRNDRLGLTAGLEESDDRFDTLV